MANEVNTQRSKLMGDMLHIEFLDGNSYLYSLQEIADIIAAQQSVERTGATCEHGIPMSRACALCGDPQP